VPRLFSRPRPIAHHDDKAKASCTRRTISTHSNTSNVVGSGCYDEGRLHVAPALTRRRRQLESDPYRVLKAGVLFPFRLSAKMICICYSCVGMSWPSDESKGSGTPGHSLASPSLDALVHFPVDGLGTALSRGSHCFDFKALGRANRETALTSRCLLSFLHTPLTDADSYYRF
jgi:hypothetical protein